jgi:hypothetical protein
VVLPAPTLHLPVDGAAVTDENALLEWNQVTGTVEYEVRFGSDNPPTDTIATTSSTDYTEYLHTDPLIAGFTYYWRVRAKDAGDNPTPWSAVRSLSLGSPADAVPMRNFYLTATPTLTWSHITWATQYQIQVSQSQNFAAPVEATLNDLEYTTPALNSGVYFWRVRARDGAGDWQNWSNVDSFFVDAS